MQSPDVVVIGAGLAGLRCAELLARAGREVVVLESAEAVGGRQRTDTLDGFLLDRGFHVFNPAYPAVQRAIDVDSLHLQRFPVGVRVRRADRFVQLAHPIRHPRLLPQTLRSGLIRPQTLGALARWILPAVFAPRRVIGGADSALRDGWDRVGLRGPLRTEVLEPFLAGVLADETGATSDSFARLLMRMFVIGHPGLPERGIAAVPTQLALAATAEGAAVRLEHRVERLRRAGRRLHLDVAGADPLSAEAVVVSAGARQASELLDAPRPATRGLQTWWFATDAAPPASAMITVDGLRRGPIVNTLVISHSARSYAPAGRHLVQATCVVSAQGARASETVVRAQLAELWGAGARSWQVLRVDDIPDALPAQNPPLRTTRAARVRPGVFVAGDHRDTASIQGALASGERIARAVLREG